MHPSSVLCRWAALWELPEKDRKLMGDSKWAQGESINRRWEEFASGSWSKGILAHIAGYDGILLGNLKPLGRWSGENSFIVSRNDLPWGTEPMENSQPEWGIVFLQIFSQSDRGASMKATFLQQSSFQKHFFQINTLGSRMPHSFVSGVFRRFSFQQTVEALAY